MPSSLTVAASDLDDTLLRSDGGVSPRCEAAIDAWLHDGRRFVIATGRPPRSIGERLPSILQGVPWICYNGAEIRQDGHVLYRNFIPEGALVELVPRVLDEYPDTIVGIELDDVLWLNRPRERQTSYHPRYRIADLREVTHHATAKVLFFSERLEELLGVFDPLPHATRLMASGRYPFFQLMAESADKVHALSFLLDGWGYGLSDVVAFGDDINDVDLLRASAVGVAVANAFPGALAVADRVTASNDEDGVAQVLEELLAER